MYITYEQYKNYGGTLDEATFNEYEFEARSWVNWYTFNRLENDDVSENEKVLRCMYKLIKLAELKAQALTLGSVTTTTTSGSETTTVTTTPAISSQSNDGVSISYNNLNASDIFDKLSTTTNGNEIESTIKQYLQGVKNSLGQIVLYRGLYPNE